MKHEWYYYKCNYEHRVSKVQSDLDKSTKDYRKIL